LEGKKRWRVYKPLDEETVLPRHSSQNFKQEEIGEPIIDCVLESGDFLYFPRGYIHQANACDDTHSLHITVSCYQLNSWGDFLSKLLPGAIETAMSENVEYRRGLPLNYLMNTGIAFDSKTTNDRKEFIKKTENLIKNLVKFAPIDAAVDQMAKQYIGDSLPPFFNASEKSRSIHGHGERWNPKKNRVDNISEIEPDTSIKLIRRNCLRFKTDSD
jgi:bifunctional lysine-specific demethylase and histidyl-hydroxylase NO66